MALTVCFFVTCAALISGPAGASSRLSFTAWTTKFAAVELKFGHELTKIGNSAADGDINLGKDEKSLNTYAHDFKLLEDSPSKAVNKDMKKLSSETADLSSEFVTLSKSPTEKIATKIKDESAQIATTSVAIEHLILAELKP